MEVNDDPAAATDEPASSPSWRMTVLVIVHLVIAMAPVTLGLITFSGYSLPFIWAITSISFAEIMLLVMWISLGHGKPINKTSAALLGTAYVSIWHSLGAILLDIENSFIEIFLRTWPAVLAFLSVLSAVMLGMRRWLGRIRYVSDPGLLDAVAQTRYSLLSALIVTTIGSCFMALLRISMVTGQSQSRAATIVEILLVIITFSLLLVCAIWAVLAPGIVRYRLTAVLVLAVLLGCSFAISAGNTPTFGGWWMFAGATLIVVVPAAIVCGSLLYLRAGGYRLVKMPAAAGSARNSVFAV